MKNKVIEGNFRKSKLTERSNVNRSRKANDELRGRRNLQSFEVEQICSAVRAGSRYPDRDELLIRVIHRHAFRISEALDLKWQHINLKTLQVAVKRRKNGIDTVHPISCKRELMLLRRAHRSAGQPLQGFVFLNERGTPISADGFRKMLSKFSLQALGVSWNPHSLRHACGTDLIDKGIDLRTVQVYLGHKNIQNTTQYLHESAKQFDKIEW